MYLREDKQKTGNSMSYLVRLTEPQAHTHLARTQPHSHVIQQVAHNQGKEVTVQT